MTYLFAFLICGGVCLLGQIIYDNTKLTPGHITSIFVVAGAFLDIFHIYDIILEIGGMGARLPITSFGHSLMHAALAKTQKMGLLGIMSGMFDMVTVGITAAVFFAFITAIIFKPKS